MTQIEWTEQTWNPIVGCSVTSPGCTNCYAMKMAHRLAGNPATPHYHGSTQMTRGGPVFTGKVALAPEKTLTAPLRRRKPTTYFVNSMGDLFHENVPDEWIDKVFAVMALCPQHTFQVLTKRASRMRTYLSNHGVGQRWAEATDDLPIDFIPVVFPEAVISWTKNGLPNVWLGVSAEGQARASERVPDLLATPAAVRFVSAEPLLGPIYLSLLDMGRGDFPSQRVVGDTMDALRGEFIYGTATGYNRTPCEKLDWVIVGGESGPGARPMHPDWARSLRDQCADADVAFFFKQWGEWAPIPDDMPSEQIESFDVQGLTAPGLVRIGKKAAGRLLDGREWNGVPKHEG